MMFLKKVLAGLAILCAGWGWSAAQADTAGNVVVNTNTPGSTTCGIQEAIDALTDEGGTVVLPIGVHTVQSHIRLKPYVTLMGLGDKSVIRKSPALQVMLAEDVSGTSTQNYVVVQDPAPLKPGQDLMLGALDRLDADVVIDKIEGPKVFLRRQQFLEHDKPVWTPSGDLKTAQKASLYNGFPLVRMNRRSVLTKLSLDGNREEQKINGEARYKDFPDWWGRLRGVPYIGGDCRVENCRVYNVAGVAVSLDNRATVIGCDIFDSCQGIHPGAGWYSRIIQNTIHHNDEDGIAMCLGDYGVIISQNHIFENKGGGIASLGVLDRSGSRVGRVGDFFNIISDNIIYRNGLAGIQSGQGLAGPEDFVITGNIVMNNWQSGDRKVDRHNVPSQICLYSAVRCLVANNRCFDDQEMYPAELAKPVAAGSVNLPLVGDPVYGLGLPMGMDPHYYEWGGYSMGFSNFNVLVTDGRQSERQVALKTTTVDRKPALVLKQPLIYSYTQGAKAIPESSRAWGIFIAGPDCRDNVVANNLCLNNRLGGILWGGSNMAPNGNIGTVVAWDEKKTVRNNVYPYAPIVLKGFDLQAGGGWTLGAGATFEPGAGLTGGPALRLAKVEPTGSVRAVFNASMDRRVFPLQPNAHYRLEAWIKTEAARDGKACLPELCLYEYAVTPGGKDGRNQDVTHNARPALDSRFQYPPVETSRWIRVAAEGRAATNTVAGMLLCCFNPGPTGTIWVSDLTVQIEDDFAQPSPPVNPQKMVQAVFGAPGAPAPAAVRGFCLKTGKPAAQDTAVTVSWDATNLYCLFQCADADLGTLRQRMMPASGFQWTDDCIAALIQPNTGHESFHYQFAVSARGAKYNQVCVDNNWDSTGFNPLWQAVVEPTAAGWQARLAIPFAELCGIGPVAGDMWRINFARSGNKEQSTWQVAENWHDPKTFGSLVFVK